MDLDEGGAQLIELIVEVLPAQFLARLGQEPGVQTDAGRRHGAAVIDARDDAVRLEHGAHRPGLGLRRQGAARAERRQDLPWRRR